MNCAVWDIVNGTLLKLGEDCEITHALRGFKPLSDSEKFKLYGCPPKFPQLAWPKSVKLLTDFDDEDDSHLC